MALLILFLYNINALGQTSIISIGKAVTQCNDFTFAKNMLIDDGLTYDENQSNENYASFYNSKAQEVEFEHLNDSIIKKDVANKYEENNTDSQEQKVDLNKIFSLGDNDPTDYNYTELGEEGIEYLDSLGIYWSDKLQSWVTKNIEMIEKLDNQESSTNSKNSETLSIL